MHRQSFCCDCEDLAHKERISEHKIYPVDQRDALRDGKILIRVGECPAINFWKERVALTFGEGYALFAPAA